MQSLSVIEFPSETPPTESSNMAMPIAALEERVNSHIKFFWVVVAFGFAWLGTITVFFVQIKGTVDRLPLQISESLVGKAKRETSSGHLPQATTALQAATALVESAQDQNLRADPKFFERQIEMLSSISQAAALLPNVNDLRFVLASYRTRLNTAPPIPKQKTEFKSPSDIDTGFSYQIYGTVFLHKNIHLSAPVPLKVALDGTSQPKRQDILTVPSRSLEDNHVSVNGIILVGASQTLDGIDWENVTFINMRIIYQSGSMKLSNVRFINCTFDLPNNQDGARIADYAALGKTDELRIG